MRLSLVLLMMLIVIPSVARSQGVILSAGGPVLRGMGGASTAAPISAIGANYWNPATISGMEHNELEFGVDLLFIDHEVSSTVGPFSGTTEAEPGTFAVPNVGWVYHTKNPRVTFGLGVNSVAGLKTNLPADPSNPVLAPVSVGGLGQVSSEAAFLQIAPSFALALTDRLSAAIGPVLTTAQVNLDPFIVASANGDGSYASGQASKYKWGGGFQAGVYYTHENCWHTGASIKSPSWIQEFEFYGEDENGLPRVMEFDLDLPMIMSLGLAHSGFDKSIFALDVRLIDYKNTDGWGDRAVFDSTGALQGMDYSSVFALSLGAQRQVMEQLYLRVGYSFNQNPVADNEAFFNIASPLIYEHMVSTGASYMLNEKLAVNVAYSYMFENTRQGPVVLPGIGAVPGSSFTNRLNVNFLSFGVVLRQ